MDRIDHFTPFRQNGTNIEPKIPGSSIALGTGNISATTGTFTNVGATTVTATTVSATTLSGDGSGITNLNLAGNDLGDLGDVDTTGAVNNDVLTFDGANWVPAIVEDFWNRTGTTISPQNAGDDLDMGTGQVDASGFNGASMLLTGTAAAVQLKPLNGIFGPQIQASASQVADYPFTLPPAQGSAGDQLQLDGSLELQWVPRSSVCQLVESVGGQDFNTAGGAAVTWATQDILDSDYTHALGTSGITINRSGLFRVTYSCSSDTAANARRTMRGSIVVNSSEVTPSVAYGYGRNNTDDAYTASATALINITSGDVLEIFTQQAGSAGISSSFANQSWVTIEFVRS